MFWVYVLKNDLSDKIYIGQTENLEKRINQHNGRNFRKSSYTKLNKGKWVSVYEEEFITREEAIKRERQLKSSRGRNFINNQILAR